VCTHPERAAIDKALALRSETYRTIANRNGVSEAALKRHAKAHLPARLAKAGEAKEVASADSLLAQVQALQTRTMAVLDGAEEDIDRPMMLRAIREARENLTLLAKLTGELAQANVLIAPMWVQLQAVIWQTLAPYPDAADALGGALSELANHDKR